MKKALQIAKSVFTWLLVIFAVFMMVFTVVSVNLFDRNDRDLFGFKAYIVQSDSMSTVNGDASKGYFKAGDLIFIKEMDAAKIEEGDIISYRSTNSENLGETVTHMVRSKTVDAEGQPGFITYGTDTNVDDDNVVTYGYVLGKYTGRIAGAGSFFNFLKTTPGYIVCIFLPFLLLIVLQGIKSVRLFKQYKAEQLQEIESQRAKEREEIEKEKAELLEERKKQEEMMEKLMKMQEAMQGSKDTEEDDSSK
ncbi:MAG: signal peptidase I [Clostridia bacterium]|nr:signal peptidase I [Clostridia bacterium]